MWGPKVSSSADEAKNHLFQLLIQAAADDAKMASEKISAHLEEIENAGHFNLYDEKIIINTRHFEWADADALFSTMRHEIEHLIFNEIGDARNNLEALLAELPPSKTDLLYQKLYQNIEQSPVYVSLKKAISHYLATSIPYTVSAGKIEVHFDDPHHELIIRLIDESLAYYQGTQFAIKQLQELIKSRKRSQIFETQIRKNNFIEALMTQPDGKSISKAFNRKISQKERLTIFKERLSAQEAVLKRLRAEIKRILEIIDAISDQEMNHFKNFVKELYAKRFKS